MIGGSNIVFISRGACPGVEPGGAVAGGEEKEPGVDHDPGPDPGGTSEAGGVIAGGEEKESGVDPDPDPAGTSEAEGAVAGGEEKESGVDPDPDPDPEGTSEA